MTLGKIACVELTSVPDMIFEARSYKYKYGLNHIVYIFRTEMPEEALFKVTYDMRDKLFLMNFI